MNSLLILIPLSIAIVVGAAVLLFWAVNHGQFEDTEGPSLLPASDADDKDAAP